MYSAPPGVYPRAGFAPPPGGSYRELNTLPGGYPRQMGYYDGIPDDGCCGMNGGALCGQGQIAEQQWTYVGHGRGTHHCAPTYVFVGQGAGAWAREEKYFPNPRSYSCLWLLAGILCFLATLAAAVLLSSLFASPELGLPAIFSGAAQHVHGHLRHAAHHIHGAASAAAHHLHSAASAAHGAVMTHAPGVLEAAGRHATNLGHHAHSLAQSAHSAIKEHGPGVWEHVKHGANVAAEHAGNAASAAHGALREHGPGVWEHVKSGAAVAAHHAGNAARAAHGAVQEHGPGVWDHVKNGASTLADHASSAASPVSTPQ
mmetsp:Transcript_2754/g.8445  ORF Transcript_2754/g.8445 Transcript_2754/m.8445 type:complete len:315 (-) Transcript_2754:165-1109(-)